MGSRSRPTQPLARLGCPHFFLGWREASSWEKLSIQQEYSLLKKRYRKKKIPFAPNLRRALLGRHELSCNYFYAPGHRYKYQAKGGTSKGLGGLALSSPGSFLLLSCSVFPSSVFAGCTCSLFLQWVTHACPTVSGHFVSLWCLPFRSAFAS